jgi:NAD dependent epimerase/dehydratase
MNLAGKRILVTGAGGFIGSHLTERLVAEGARVRPFVRYNSSNSWGWLDRIPREVSKELDVVTGDIRDPHGVATAMKGVDLVFHLAALIGIPFSYYAPDSYVDTNVRGTLNVLTAARDHGLERVIVTSTSEVYGTARYVPIDEEHPRQGQSPYSATKIGADAVAESFYRSFQLPVTVVRPFNTYGPRQSARAIIPTIIIQLLSDRGTVELGSVHPTRDLLFVEDTVAGFVEVALTAETIGQEVNIATESEISMGKLAEKLISLVGREAHVVTDSARVRPDKSEVERLLGSNRKIRTLTAWKPKYSLDEGLLATVEWFKNGENLAGYKADIYNV